MENLKSDVYFILGKIQHVQKNFAQALDFYLKAVKLNEKNLPAQFNLGKVFFYNESFLQAESCLEIVIKSPKHKDCFEALRLLAQTKSRLNKTQESFELFKRVLELNPKDFEANIEIGQMFDQSEPQLAIVYYEKALKIIISNIEEAKLNSEDMLGGDGNDIERQLVPPELLINIGTLRLEVGKHKEAYEAFSQAIENCDKLLEVKKEGFEDHNKLLAIRITARFNLAYWYEMEHKLGDASEIYKSIIREEPSYLDAYLRLSYLAKNRGNHQRALELLEDAKKNASNSRVLPIY